MTTEIIERALRNFERRIAESLATPRSPFAGETITQSTGATTANSVMPIPPIRIRYYEPFPIIYQPTGFLLCGCTGGEETLEESMERWGREDRRWRFPTTDFDVTADGYSLDLKAPL